MRYVNEDVICERFFFDNKILHVVEDVIAWYVFIIESLAHASTADMQGGNMNLALESFL
jgi:hypothetical protein